ncbi:hypothetical protein HDU91_001724 [Kappamyces sp. JEL0680]|nr:hypothetical protein HDU91_001724 [Kappamyces sp. JEL0680]
MVQDAMWAAHQMEKTPGVKENTVFSVIRGKDSSGKSVRVLGASQALRGTVQVEDYRKVNKKATRQEISQARANRFDENSALSKTNKKACRVTNPLGQCAEHEVYDNFVAAGGKEIRHSVAVQKKADNVIKAVSRCETCQQFPALDVAVSDRENVHDTTIIKADPDRAVEGYDYRSRKAPQKKRKG